MKLTTHLHPFPRPRRRGSIHPLPERLHDVVLNYRTVSSFRLTGTQCVIHVFVHPYKNARTVCWSVVIKPKAKMWLPAVDMETVCVIFLRVEVTIFQSLTIASSSLQNGRKLPCKVTGIGYEKAVYQFRPIYRVFQKELYKIESLCKFIQRTCTVFWAKHDECYLV
jgi:hypothetical protein